MNVNIIIVALDDDLVVIVVVMVVTSNMSWGVAVRNPRIIVEMYLIIVEALIEMMLVHTESG